MRNSLYKAAWRSMPSLPSKRADAAKLSDHKPANEQIQPQRLAKFNCMRPTTSIRKYYAQETARFPGRAAAKGRASMHINPRQIEAFRTVMLTGSMTAAAEMLKVTQPAVSRLIKDLEAELNLRLFRREGNRLVPSHEATILFVEVDRFYVGMDRIAKTANDLRHAKVGALRIASIGALSLSCITQAISILHSARPAVDISLESLNSHQTLDLVAGRHFDVGFAQAVAEFPGVELTPMPSVETVCVVPASYPIAEKDYLEPRDLEGLPFISLGRNSPQRMKIDQLFDELGISRQMVLQTSLAASAIGLVASGLGVSIVDPFTANYLSSPNVVTRPFKSHFRFEIVAARPSHYQQSRLCREFIEIMRELFKKQAAAAAA